MRGIAPVKVCFLAPELLPNRGGVGTYSIGVLRELTRQADVVVVTPQRWEGTETYTASQVEAYFDGRLRAETVSEARDSFVYNARFQWALLRRLPALVRREGFDVVQSHHAHMPDLLSGELGPMPPIVRTVHSTIRGQREGIAAADRLGGGARDPADRWQIGLAPLLAAAERRVLARPGDRYLAVSGWMAGQLERRGIAADRIGLAYCGVDPDRFRPDLRAPDRLRRGPDERIILFPSRPTLIRGSAVLARAIPRIVDGYPGARVVVTGAPQADAERVMPVPPAYREHVRYLGFQPYDRLPEIYASSDLVVVPTFYDNFPIRALEAMASGVPVVATPVGGIPEMIEPDISGVLTPAGDPAALADAVLRVLRDPGLAQRLGRAGRSRVAERFTWKLAAQATIAAYRTAVDGSSTGRRR